MSFVHLGALAAAVLLTACTYGAPSASSSGAGPGVVVVDVNLTVHPVGYAPATLTVPVGTRIQFTNSDSFAHTATSIVGSTFPLASPFDITAQTPEGSNLSAPWGSGVLAAGGSSSVFVADRPGTYLYGCFFHYGHPMQGTIVVQ
jgi:plastocyanin